MDNKDGGGIDRPYATEVSPPGAPVPGYFTIHRGDTVGNLPVSFHLASGAGYATPGVDYKTSPVSLNGGVVTIPSGSDHLTIAITPLADGQAEAPERVVLTLDPAPGGGCCCGGSSYSLGSPSTATITISDDPALVAITSNPASAVGAIPTASEGTPPVVGAFVATRSAGDPSLPLTVTYTTATGLGMATPFGVAGADYTLTTVHTVPNGQATNDPPGQFTFNAGETKVQLVLTPVDDNLIESSEQATIALTPRNGCAAISAYNVSSPGSATITILDDDLRLDAHRAGGKQGELVSKAIQHGNDPTKYLMLVNDDYSMMLPTGLPDNTSANASLPTGGPTGPGDLDLARMTLKGILSGLRTGTYQINLSDPSAVRLFKSDGTLLFKQGQTSPSALTLNLASPSGYLAGLLTGDVDVWVEGLAKSPNFTFSVSYSDPSRYVSAADGVHLMIADWTFQGVGGGQVTEVTPVWKQALMAGVRRAQLLGTPTQITADPEGYFYKNLIDGLPSALVASLRVTSDSDASDFYDDQLVSSTTQSVSTRFAGLYSADRIYLADPDATVTATERAAILQQLGLNVVHNPGMKAKLTTGDPATPTDIMERGIGITPLVDIDLNQDVVHVGDHVTGNVYGVQTDGGWSFNVTTSDGQVTSGNTPGGAPTLAFDFVVNTPGIYLVRGQGLKLAGHKGDTSLYGGNSALVYVLPQGQNMPLWTKKAWDALHVAAHVPGDAINRNRRITKLYADMYNSGGPVPLGQGGAAHPIAFEWAGIAAFASTLAGDGMSMAERGGFAPAGFAQGFVQGLLGPFGRIISVPTIPDSTSLLNYLWQGNFAIFMDMYPQLLAYQAGGIGEIRAMKGRGEIKTQAQLDAWVLIDDGVTNRNDAKVWEGTALLYSARPNLAQIVGGLARA